MLPFLPFGLAYAQAKPKPLIKSERKIYTRQMRNGEWKRGEVGCDDEYNEYNQKGNLIKCFEIVYDDGSRTDSLKLDQQNFYQNDKLIKEEHHHGTAYKFKEIFYKYDSVGRQVSAKVVYLDDMQKEVGLPEANEKTIKKYDALNNIIKSTLIFIPTNEVLRTVIYKYDRQNRLIYQKAKGINSIVATYSYNNDGTLKRETFKIGAHKEITTYKYIKHDQFGNWTVQLKAEKVFAGKPEPDEISFIGNKRYSIETWRIVREIKYD